MKKIVLTLIALHAVCGLLTPSQSVNAAAGGVELDFTASPSSATANGTSKIIFNLHAYVYKCDNGYSPGYDGTCADGSTPDNKQGSANLQVSIYTTTTGNIFGGTTTVDNYPTVTTNAEGKASLTVASTSADSKKFTAFFTESKQPTHASNPSVTVTFNAPAAPAPAPVEVKPPDAPKAASVEVNGQAMTDQAVIIKETEALVLKGTTVAKGVVKLFIFSEPKEASVTADAQGNWSYEVSGLEPGEHRVEAEVTDPVTSKTSSRAVLAAFTVEAAPVPVVAETPAPTTPMWVWYAVAGGAVVFAAAVTAGVWWWMKKRGTPAAHKPQDTPPVPPSADDTTLPKV